MRLLSPLITLTTNQAHAQQDDLHLQRNIDSAVKEVVYNINDYMPKLHSLLKGQRAIVDPSDSQRISFHHQTTPDVPYMIAQDNNKTVHLQVDIKKNEAIILIKEIGVLSDRLHIDCSSKSPQVFWGQYQSNVGALGLKYYKYQLEYSDSQACYLQDSMGSAKNEGICVQKDLDRMFNGICVLLEKDDKL